MSSKVCEGMTLAVMALLAVWCSTSGSFADAAPLFTKDEPYVKVVGAQNYRTEVVDPTLPVVVTFFQPNSPSCKKAAPIIRQVAAALDGYARFVAVDTTQEDGAGLGEMYGVKNYPTVALFNPELFPVEGGQEGQYMKLPAAFPSTNFDAITLAQWVIVASASDQIDRIEDMDDLKSFLSKYELSSLPKVLLFTGSNMTSPIFRAMSLEYRYGALFGVVRSNATDVCAHYGVHSFPQLLTVGEESDFLPDAAHTTLKAVKAFIGKTAFDKMKRLQLQSFFLQEEIKQRRRDAEQERLNRAKPPFIVRTEKDWKAQCIDRAKGYCVVVFVESLAEDLNSTMDMLLNASKQMTQRSNHDLQVVVVDGFVNKALADFFLAINGFPTVVFLNPARRAMHMHIGSFTSKSIVNFFLDKVTSARGKTYSKKIPFFEPRDPPKTEETKKKEDTKKEEGAPEAKKKKTASSSADGNKKAKQEVPKEKQPNRGNEKEKKDQQERHPKNEKDDDFISDEM